LTHNHPSPIPYLALSGVCLAAMAGDQLFTFFFFPAFAPWVAGLALDLLALFSALRAWVLYQALWKRRTDALNLVEKILRGRDAKTFKTGPSADTAQRTLSRVIRNADEDLREIAPDYSEVSLSRLADFLPKLLDEMNTETDAMIRLGVAGAYIGETACRLWKWEWKFQADPSLRQFEYLASVLERQGASIDPFELAQQCFSGKMKAKELTVKLGKDIQ
jgi:hypothetical protein